MGIAAWGEPNTDIGPMRSAGTAGGSALNVDSVGSAIAMMDGAPRRSVGTAGGSAALNVDSTGSAVVTVGAGSMRSVGAAAGSIGASSLVAGCGSTWFGVAFGGTAGTILTAG